MKTKFDLGEQLNDFSKRAKKLDDDIQEKLKDNARIACKEMIFTAKSLTPHSRDGKYRGNNVISDSMYNSWRASFSFSNGGSVSLTNKMPYAIYVQNGHKVSRHFVPWLYIDDMGRISYEKNHNQKLFGLVVGTKTKYVNGIDMIGPSVERFYEVFGKMNDELLNGL